MAGTLSEPFGQIDPRLTNIGVTWSWGYMEQVRMRSCVFNVNWSQLWQDLTTLPTKVSQNLIRVKEFCWCYSNSLLPTWCAAGMCINRYRVLLMCTIVHATAMAPPQYIHVSSEFSFRRNSGSFKHAQCWRLCCAHWKHRRFSPQRFCVRVLSFKRICGKHVLAMASISMFQS